jgi:hypothetical protein
MFAVHHSYVNASVNFVTMYLGLAVGRRPKIQKLRTRSGIIPLADGPSPKHHGRGSWALVAHIGSLAEDFGLWPMVLWRTSMKFIGYLTIVAHQRIDIEITLSTLSTLRFLKVDRDSIAITMCCTTLSTWSTLVCPVFYRYKSCYRYLSEMAR